MKRHFKIVHFVPDPVAGTRVPMGAIVSRGDTRRVAVAKHLPGAECLGSRQAARLLNFLVDDFKNIGSADDVRQRMGPEVLVDDARPIPDGVEDPVAWIEAFVLPRPIEADQKKTTPRRTSRYMEGKNFLSQHNVGQYIRRSFRPGKVFSHTDGAMKHLGKVSQYVADNQTVLLMEPLVPRRPEWEDDLTDINTTFYAYRYHVENGLNGHDGELIAYILPGGSEEQRSEMKQTLKTATSFVDTTHAHQLERFINQVRRVGKNQEELNV